MFWLTDRCHKERVINCQQAPRPEVDVTPLRPLYTFVWSTFIKVRTADPTWLLHNISVYKIRSWKIKNWDQFLEILVSSCHSLSQTLAEFPSAVRSPPSLLILPGLLDPTGEASVSPLLWENRMRPAAYVSGANFLSWSFIGFLHKPSYSASFLH